MKTYTVTITQTETRVFTLKAESEDAAIEQAQEWNEEESGSTPEGCEKYDYSFDSSTDVAEVASHPPITDQLCLDMLTAAVEGGSVYWLACKSITRDADLNVTGLIGPFDREDLSEKWDDITLDTMRLGVSRIIDPSFKISPSIRADLIAVLADADNPSWDAETADCVLQAGMFNDIVYG